KGPAFFRFFACLGTFNRDWLVALAFQPAGSGDFRVAHFGSTGLESPVNRQAGKPALRQRPRQLSAFVTFFAVLWSDWMATPQPGLEISRLAHFYEESANKTG